MFSIHVGDFKSGWSPCTDALFTQRRDWFNLFHQPLIFTPGDNEWTDCHRAFGAAFDPLERLQKLRALFFADAVSLGQQKMALTRQTPDFPENARWEHQGIVFATINVPGSHNNKAMPKEKAARDTANDAWIRAAFDGARAKSQRAVVIAMQANPFSSDIKRGPYAAILRALTRETVNFSGEVLLIHGDTHRYRMDQPLPDPRARATLSRIVRSASFVAAKMPTSTGGAFSETSLDARPYSQQLPATTTRFTPALATASSSRRLESRFRRQRSSE